MLRHVWEFLSVRTQQCACTSYRGSDFSEPVTVLIENIRYFLSYASMEKIMIVYILVIELSRCFLKISFASMHLFFSNALLAVSYETV